jgi:glycerol kinase
MPIPALLPNAIRSKVAVVPVIVGLTRAVTKGDLARATLEAICYQTKEILEAMAADSGLTLSEMRVDGGINGGKRWSDHFIG